MWSSTLTLRFCKEKIKVQNFANFSNAPREKLNDGKTPVLIGFTLIFSRSTTGRMARASGREICVDVGVYVRVGENGQNKRSREGR